MNAIDLFAGPGGWDVGARELGIDPLGIESDDAACQTRAAAGLRTHQGDVAALDPHDFGPCDLLIASPPCQAWSMAGKREGQKDIENVYFLTAEIADPDGEPGRDSDAYWADPRSRLVTEPLRWALALEPDLIAWEQVPPVLDYWKHCASILRERGYGTWAGIVSAERFGIVEPCPLHESHALAAVKSSSGPGREEPGCAGSAGTTGQAESNAWNAERRSRFARSRAFAQTHAGMRDDCEATELALDVALRSRASIAAAIAPGATPPERLRLLAQLAQREQPTATGRVDDGWMSAAMSECGWTVDTAESIGSWLNSYLGEPSLAEKWSTTSMEIRQTTIRRTLRSIAAMLTTWPRTGPASREAGCGLCIEIATPQTRKRAILMAAKGRPVHPPQPTHQAYVPGEPAQHQHTLEGELLPWVSMADALGWSGSVATNTFPRRGGAQKSRTERGMERDASDPAVTVDGQVGRWDRADCPASPHLPSYRRTRGSGVSERHGDRPSTPADEPAPTLTSKARSDEWEYDTRYGGFGKDADLRGGA